MAGEKLPYKIGQVLVGSIATIGSISSAGGSKSYIRVGIMDDNKLVEGLLSSTENFLTDVLVLSDVIDKGMGLRLEFTGMSKPNPKTGKVYPQFNTNFAPVGT